MTSARKQSVGVMTKFSGTMKSAAASLIFKNRDPDFEHMLQFINSFQKKIQSFGLLSEEIAKERFCKYEVLWIIVTAWIGILDCKLAFQVSSQVELQHVPSMQVILSAKRYFE